ncbi:MAG TPA: hypothetical protein VJM32_00240 [Candidatus Saccharimonadales bacterium]|nr:hypothetical protein [Candidatus Saccharimonadales bacterium]
MQTATVQQTRRVVEQQREADFEAYQHWEYERRLYDEVTDAAERVRAPISPKQEFELSDDGLVSARGELLRPVLMVGLAEAQRMAMTNPDWQVEVVRRTIDLQEYDDLERLARAGEGSGALVSYWLIPDAVVEGSTIPGYNRERLKMFTRVAVPTAKGLEIKYHSYDGSYRPGVQAMDELLGFAFDANRTSEQIASERRFLEGPVPSIDELDEVLRQAYDDTLTRDFGGEWFGGRRPLPVRDVLGFITNQHGLLREHMGQLGRIFATTADPHQRNKLMEPHRYNLAAALDDLLHGKQVTNASEAGDNARSEGRNLDGDCPTGEGDDESAANQLGSLGFKTGRRERARMWANRECRTCLVKKAVDISQCHMCLDCEETHNQFGNAGLDQIMRDAKDRKTREARFGALGRKRRAAAGKMVLHQVEPLAELAE